LPVTLHEGFLRALRDNPRDETTWLVLADWLEEQGDPLATLYRQRRLANSIGMQFLLVPPGAFLMGAPETAEEDSRRDGPRHEVEITRPFYLGVYPVTQEEYQQVMGTNPSHFSATGRGRRTVRKLDTRRFPVESVSWDDAVAFCRKLSELPAEKAAGRVYRLLTEAEWEYACTGGPLFPTSPGPFYFDRPTASLSSAQANFKGDEPFGGAAPGPFLRRTSRVGSYPPNPLGLYDMHGNVTEWCADWHDPDYYQHSPRQDPPGPPSSARNQRVLRGGAWSLPGWACLATNRDCLNPAVRGNDIVGFRVALVVGAETAG
jgi:uncharacterized protein (TIGR02996 family)